MVQDPFAHVTGNEKIKSSGTLLLLSVDNTPIASKAPSAVPWIQSCRCAAIDAAALRALDSFLASSTAAPLCCTWVIRSCTPLQVKKEEWLERGSKHPDAQK
eukprot:41441-Eustigmatos_ZCMA.PRE.1